MGQKIASISNFENGGACAVGATTTNSETQVILNVYDLTPFNHYTVWFGFGIFHSGIEGEPAEFPSLETVHVLEEKEKARSVIDGRYTCTSINYQSLTDTFCLFHGMEYGFGAHDFPISGVFEVEPKTCPGFIFRRSIPLGRINMPPSEVRTFVETMASEYHGNTYHLISKNCNHFTDDIAWRLTGKHIPGWVNRLARMGALCSCLLPESLQVTTVKQLPEYHTCTEDGTESLSTATHESAAESDESEKVLLSPSAGNSDVTFIKEIHR